MNRLVFPATEMSELRHRLLASSSERAALVLAQPVRLEDGWRLLVLHSEFIGDDEYSLQTPQSLEIPPGRLAPILKRARDERLAIVLTHTHPWDGPVHPSPIDLSGEAALVPRMFQRVPGVVHGRLIFGRKDTHAAIFVDPDTESGLEVLETGVALNKPPRLETTPPISDSYSRQIQAFGVQAQERLAQTRVAIVGLGGTGSVVAETLAHLGVRDFLLIDPDTIERSNLNRIAGATPSDVGFPKVQVAEAAIKRVSPDARVDPYIDDVTKRLVARRLLSADFFFCCTDSHGSRAILTQLCYQYYLPGIDLGVRIDAAGGMVKHMIGRIQMLSPGLACTTCTNLLDPDAVRRDLLSATQRRADPYITGDHIDQPAVMSINTAVAGAAVTMFLSAICGVPVESRHQLLLFNRGIGRSIANSPDPDCVICSRHGFFARGDSWPQPGRPDQER